MPRSPADTPAALYREVWKIIGEHYLFRERLGDWKRWQRKFRGKTVEEAVAAVRVMLLAIGDPAMSIEKAASDDKPVPPTPATNLPLCSSSMVTDGVLRLRIEHFAHHDVHTMIQSELLNAPAWEALIIDLRGNGGGLLQPAVQALSLFINEGVTNIIEYGNGVRTRSLVTADGITDEAEAAPGTWVPISRVDRLPNLLAGRPVVVLVDNNSASASELLALALRKHAGAYIVGNEKTRGKGTSQTCRKLPCGYQLWMTNSRWLSADGEFVGDAGLNAVGVTPDFTVPRLFGAQAVEDAALHHLRAHVSEDALSGLRRENIVATNPLGGFQLFALLGATVVAALTGLDRKR